MKKLSLYLAAFSFVIAAVLFLNPENAFGATEKYSPLFEASLQTSLREFDEKEAGQYLKDETQALTENLGEKDKGSVDFREKEVAFGVPGIPSVTSSYSCGATCGSTCGSTCGATCGYSCGSTCGTTCSSTCTTTCTVTCGSTCSTTCSGGSPTCSGFSTCGGNTCGSTCYGSSTCQGSSTCFGSSTCQGSSTCVGNSTCAGSSTCAGGSTCYGTSTCGGSSTCISSSTCSTWGACLPSSGSSGSSTGGGSSGGQTNVPITETPTQGGNSPPSGSVGSAVGTTSSLTNQGGYREQLAEELNKLGILAGDGSGYNLGGQPTRAQAAVMLVRLLGKSGEAAQGGSHPFKDVPDWANGAVGYVYANNLSSGISEVEFGSDNYVNYLQYTTFVLKALGYTNSDFSWDKSHLKAAEIGLYSSYDSKRFAEKSFNRDDMVYISYRALNTAVKGSDTRLIDKLINEGSITVNDKTINILGKRGAGSGNSVNYAQAANYGEYIYYIDAGDCAIYKIKETDMAAANYAAKELVVDGMYLELNIVGKKLYFSDLAYGYYSSNLDGSGIVTITEDMVYYPNIVNGVVYYKNAEDGMLYSVNVNGSGKKRITNVEAGAINAFESGIYFMNITDGFKPYFVNLDGSGLRKISDSECWRMNVSCGYIYYAKYSNSGIYRMKIDGSQVETITSAADPDLLLYSNGYVYYSEGSALSKVNVSTGEISAVMKFSSDVLSLGVLNNSICATDGIDTAFILLE